MTRNGNRALLPESGGFNSRSMILDLSIQFPHPFSAKGTYNEHIESIKDFFPNIKPNPPHFSGGSPWYMAAFSDIVETVGARRQLRCRLFLFFPIFVWGVLYFG
ncbi:MAG TPA: hypothetical protein VIF12_00900 [Micavibrio sp.]